MAPLAPLALYASRPPTFWYFLQDSLVSLGLPYGPQARERLARAYPDLFGQSDSTLRGYARWLKRTASSDTCESFARFMHDRYTRWVSSRGSASATPADLNQPRVRRTWSINRSISSGLAR